MLEQIDTHPDVNVQEAEYARLLGWPRGHAPGERAQELAAWARRWYAEHGRPWVYLREATLDLTSDTPRIDDVAFHSKQLREHLTNTGATRVVLVAVSAGRSCEEYASQLWQESKPDEYFFLEIFGSAVVEHLVASTSGRICDAAERDGLMAVPHYSPGYSGWDVADQVPLFNLIKSCAGHAFPEPLEVLSSGMLRPKKSLLAVFGLTARNETALNSPRLVPCTNCSFSPCRYRRAAYRHRPAQIEGAPALKNDEAFPLTRDARYTVNARALRKWAQERVTLAPRDDGSLEARFRFDGTTCSNMGRPLTFDYRVTLSPAHDGFTIRESECRPAPGDTGYTHMCEYLADASGLMSAIGTEAPLLGRPLDEVLAWQRHAAPSGCYCDSASRAHKWGLALEAIHYALAQRSAQTSAQNSSATFSSTAS